ncbi:MAG TPA: hypothetical protein VHZ50_18020 [Puia sp.]|jgi:hypothetical protein|nr:hypothetical protein [Puia sp.]
MKRLFLALILVAGTTAIATNANAQVYIGAHIGVRLPIHRGYYAPQVVYNTPAPYYDNEIAPAPCYDNGVVINAPVYGYGGYHSYNRYYGRGYNRNYNRGYHERGGRSYGRRR